MSEKFIIADRDQMSLLPYDLRNWVPKDDIVHFIIEAVENIPTKHFKVNSRGTGDAQYHPHLMLTLLVYCYTNGIFGSRRIERATYSDIYVRFICANTHPDYSTICRFRRDNEKAISETFLHVLTLAKELNILKVGTVSVDGTKLRANANIDKNVRYDRACQLEKQLEIDIKDLMAKAETCDNTDDNDNRKLPEEISRREKLREKMAQAQRKLEKRAELRHQEIQNRHSKNIAEWEKDKTSGHKPKVTTSKPEPKPENQMNLTDEDSRLMRKSTRSEFQQAYNAQAVVDADGSQLVLSARISTCANDFNELVLDVQSIPTQLGKPLKVLADSGYATGCEVRALQKDNIEVFVPVRDGSNNSNNERRRYDYRPEKQPKELRKTESKDNGDQTEPWVKDMSAKMKLPEVKNQYKKRKQSVETVFGIIKQAMGFRQFLTRGVKNVKNEWNLVVVAYNFRRLYRLINI